GFISGSFVEGQGYANHLRKDEQMQDIDIIIEVGELDSNDQLILIPNVPGFSTRPILYEQIKTTYMHFIPKRSGKTPEKSQEIEFRYLFSAIELILAKRRTYAQQILNVLWMCETIDLNTYDSEDILCKNLSKQWIDYANTTFQHKKSNSDQMDAEYIEYLQKFDHGEITYDYLNLCLTFNKVMIKPLPAYDIEGNATIQPNLLESLNNLTNVQTAIERVLPLIPNKRDDSELKLHLPRTVTDNHPNGPNIIHHVAESC
ncbi:unnamed protein product, partial [Didymodactylos carnosus]